MRDAWASEFGRATVVGKGVICSRQVLLTDSGRLAILVDSSSTNDSSDGVSITDGIFNVLEHENRYPLSSSITIGTSIKPARLLVNSNVLSSSFAESVIT